MGFKNYLKLRRRKDDPPIIVYRVDNNGKPILDYEKIEIINFRIEGSDLVLAFDSKNEYKFMRYEILEKSFEKFGKLKELVDKKISDLEDKVDSEGVGQNV